MDNIQFQSYLIEERSYVSFIKREIHNLARQHFSEKRTGEIDIVASELCSNIVKFADRGEVLYRLSSESEQPVFELICIDNGPGMKDVSHAIRDGFSTRNTLGHGLGSIQRLSNFMQIYSQPDWGTVIYCSFYEDPGFISPKKNATYRCLNVAMPGEKVSGDGVSIRHVQNKTLVLVGDGLGHGKAAKEAVDKAIEVFNASTFSDPAEILREINAGVKKTRGLVATVATLDHHIKQIYVCGIGNIALKIQKGLDSKNYVSHNGIIGLNIPGRIESAVYPLEKMHQLIFCSDGIRSKWEQGHYAGILKFDPMLLAAVLYKDHARRTDDMTIVAVKIK